MEFVIIWLACVVMACFISGGKEQGTAGFWLAFFLGPLGVLITLCLPNLRKGREEAALFLQNQRQLQLQQEEIRELRALRAQLAMGMTSAPRPSPPPLPRHRPPTQVIVDDFVPENLRGSQRWKR